MKSRRLSLVMLLAVLPAFSASAQVMPLGQVPANGLVQQVSCDGCAGGCSGGCGGGTVWGTGCCNLNNGLYPPCPNPCQTTLLADLVCDVKTAVDTSLGNLFCCVLGLGQQLACGCVDACSCGAGSYGCGAAEYGCGAPGYGGGGCDCGACSGGVAAGSPAMMTQPTPAYHTPSVPTATPPTVEAGQPNPFNDDPQPAIQPIPSGSTSRNVQPARRPTSVARQPAPSRVRQASHQQSRRVAKPAPQRIGQRNVSARPIQATSQGHYAPRRAASIRTSNGRQLQKAAIKTSAPQSSLRFR